MAMDIVARKGFLDYDSKKSSSWVEKSASAIVVGTPMEETKTQNYSMNQANYDMSAYSGANVSVSSLVLNLEKRTLAGSAVGNGNGDSRTAHIKVVAYDKNMSTVRPASSDWSYTARFSIGGTNTFPARTVNLPVSTVSRYGAKFALLSWVTTTGADTVHYAPIELFGALSVTYTKYSAERAPSWVSPSSGKFLAGTALTASWKFNPADENDYQISSTLQYSTNGGSSWTAKTVSGTANTYTFPANTFSQGASVQMKAAVTGPGGTSGYTSPVILTAYQAKAPDTLTPASGAYRNPAAVIPLSWNFVKSDYKDEVQSSSNLQYRINGGSWTGQTVSGRTNAYSFRSGFFQDGDKIDWRVQTVSNVGTSPWSAIASFSLAITPPLAPILTYPVNADVTAVNGVNLQWIYNSEYDTKASRFDIKYQADGGAAATVSNSGQTTVLLDDPLITDGKQHTVVWQVLGYSEFGDPGTWSEAATFWTIGLPDAPVIVSVTNSNLPTVNFSLANVSGWELEILHDGVIVYSTGNRPFEGVMVYKLTDFLASDNYVARMRVTNQYGLQSGWGELAFSIDTAPPDPPGLTIAYNTDYYIRLFIESKSEAAYVYRSEFGEDNFKRIAKTTDKFYDDYTAAPEIRYEYFVRVVDANGSYADSGRKAQMLEFIDTTIADAGSPGDMVKLKFGLGVKPQKSMTLGHNTNSIQLEGREFPLLVKGIGRSQSVAYSFYCSRNDLIKLEELAADGGVLILRERRYGAMYGGIIGDISVTPETFSGFGEFVVNFTFTRTDYEDEVNL